jgi:hypothetical protein
VDVEGPCPRSWRLPLRYGQAWTRLPGVTADYLRAPLGVWKLPRGVAGERFAAIARAIGKPPTQAPPDQIDAYSVPGRRVLRQEAGGRFRHCRRRAFLGSP